MSHHTTLTDSTFHHIVVVDSNSRSWAWFIICMAPGHFIQGTRSSSLQDMNCLTPTALQDSACCASNHTPGQLQKQWLHPYTATLHTILLMCASAA